ncbi:MAG: class I SAM-dependent methyltransferase [Pseudomonadota bacterium]
MSKIIDTWSKEPEHEDGMTDEHAWIWREIIAAVPPIPLGGKVLDVGCNQGGFLRMLYDHSPFSTGVGIDLARDAIAHAEARKEGRPLRYLATTKISDAGTGFDAAFSHEVIYLVRDLVDHARQVADALAPGASYHAVTCCHSDSPLWATWRPMIAQFSNIYVPNHSVDDIASAFRAARFEVSLKRFLANASIPMEDGPSAYFPTDRDRLETYTRWKLLFTCRKPT